MDGDHYIINGSKTWTSFGEIADYCYLICRTSSEGSWHSGLSKIVVPLGSPGITISVVADMTGNRHFCDATYEDVAVPAGNLEG